MYPSDDYPVLLHFVTHAVNLLDVGEDHFGVQSVVCDHSFHVIGSQEIRNTRVPPEIQQNVITSKAKKHRFLLLLSGFECQFVILSPIGTVNLGEVESLWEEVMDERTKGYAIGPGGGKIFNLNVLRTEK